MKTKEEITAGDLYQDCTEHPILCLSNDPDMDFIRGISLLDGSLRSCSLIYGKVRHITVEEVEAIKFPKLPIYTDKEAEVVLSNVIRYLAVYYKTDPVAIAKLCDEELDRSGRLLGVVRKAAE